MEWLSAHRYAVLFSGAALILLLIVGASTQSSVSPQAGSTISVSVGAVPVSPSQIVPNTAHTPISSPPFMSSTSSSAPLPTRSVPHTTSTPTVPLPAINGTPTSPVSTFTAASSSMFMNTNLINLIYSLTAAPTPIPAVAQTAPARTPEQQALYNYGNHAGLAVLSFENSHTDMAQVLQNWIKHRTDPNAQAGVSLIARDMLTAGASLKNLPNVPVAAQAVNNALAAGFSNASAQLSSILTQSASDSGLATAMQTYNSAADAYTKSYLTIVDFFTLREITFGASDPGSVFSIPQ